MSLHKTWIGASALVVAIGASLAAAQSAGTMGKAVTPAQIVWGKAPPGMPPAVQAAVLEGDPSQPGPFVVRLRLPDGTQIRPHWHSTDEAITVISGDFQVGMGDAWSTQQMVDLPAGGFTSMPAQHRHFALARGETIVQVSSTGPFDIHYINPKDDPRTMQRPSQ
jgi:hypothetical protein